MRKLTTLLLIFALTISVGCKKNALNPTNLTQTGTTDSDLITTNGGGASTNPSDVAAFINKYAGVYYGEGNHMYAEWGKKEWLTGKMVHYKFKDGQILTLNCYNQSANLLTSSVQASVLPSANKLQISNYAKGTIEVLNLRDDGLDAYTSFILEKTSDEADIEGMQSVIMHKSLSAYKGTYKSVSDNKDKFLSVDENGQVYFYEKVAEENISVSENQLTIVKDNIRNTIILEQGIYRKYDKNLVDTTAIVCEVTKDFIENIPVNKSSTYATADFKAAPRWKGDIPQVTGFDITINEPKKMDGSVCISGAYGNRYKKGTKASSDMVAHVTILKGKTLHIMGRYDCTMTFSDDWKTLTYEGNTLNLK